MLKTQTMTKIGENTENPIVKADIFFSSLDTLAQLYTSPPKKAENPFKKRAIAKYKTVELILPLIDLDDTLTKQYWSTFHCCSVLLQDGNKITGKYCNNRWCIVCNRIRTAKLINGYLPAINENIKKPYFVTLTIPNIPEHELKPAIIEMIKTIRRVTDLFRNRREFRLKGIRKIECTYNSRRNDFHPHLHLLIDGEKESRQLIDYWLKSYPDANIEAQDMRPANKDSLIELFKYSTKLIAKTKTEVKALNGVFKALRKKRVFQPIGLKKINVSEDIDTIQAQEIDDLKSAVDTWVWEHEVKDWINTYGELLTTYQ